MQLFSEPEFTPYDKFGPSDAISMFIIVSTKAHHCGPTAY